MVAILDSYEPPYCGNIYLYDLINLFNQFHVNPLGLRLFNHQFLSKNSKQFHPFEQVIDNLLFSLFLLFSPIFSYFHIYYPSFYKHVNTSNALLF
jgi:hypothetical protein